MVDASDLEQEKEEQIKEIETEKDTPQQAKDKEFVDKLRKIKEIPEIVTPEKKEEPKQEVKEERHKARRLINTDAERGIKREEMNKYDEDAEEQERHEQEAQDEAKEIQENKKVSKPENKKTTMTAQLIFAETEARLQRIIAKDKAGETLTSEEMQMLVLQTEIMKAEQTLQARLESADEIYAEKQKLENETREYIISQYKKTEQEHPEQILRNGLGPKQDGYVVGKNFLKSMAFIVSTHWAIKYGYVKLVKVWKERGVEEIYLRKMPKFVEFWSTNERGEDQVTISKVTLKNYRLNGTTIPICYAVEGFIDSYDFFGNMRDEYTQELFQKQLLLNYWSGVLKNKETFPDQKEESFWSKYKLLLIIAGVFLLLIGLAYYAQLQQINGMQEQISTLTTLLQTSQNLIDTNAIIIKGGTTVAGVGA